MNKTVAANISGIIFNIEEGAYDRLKAYLEAIRTSFEHAEGRDEIMADIEARIAELFSERIHDRKEVIGIKDVEEVIGIMGDPSAYIDEEEAEAREAYEREQSYQEQSKSQRKRSTPQESSRKRRIFRDSENSVLGGVCSGISNYFDWDPIFLRLLFVFLFLSFGTGLILYIILWIVIPEAKTTAEKLEMKGKRVNVENIGKAFNEGKEKAKDTFDEFADDLKKIDTEYHAQRAKKAIGKGADFLRTIFHVFGKFLGVAFIVVALGMLVVLGIVMISGDNYISFTDEGVASITYNQLSTILFEDSTMATIAFIGIFLAIGIPILSFLYTGVKLVFEIRQSYKPLSITLAAVWGVGLILCGYVALSTGTDFAQRRKVDTNFALEQPTGDTLYLDVSEDIYFSNYIRNHHDFKPELIQVGEEKIHFGWPLLDVIENHEDSVFAIEVIRSSCGPTQKSAINRARAIEYNITQQDSLIKFDAFYSIDKSDLLRAQEIQINVKVPRGKTVFLTKGMDRIIYDIDNYTDELDSDMVGRYWTMTENGLECIGCRFLNNE